MPTKFRVKPPQKWPKGVENRNKGLEWILKHVEETGDDSGVFYFADDDNTYDIRLFEEVPVVDFTNILRKAFASADPYSIKI